MNAPKILYTDLSQYTFSVSGSFTSPSSSLTNLNSYERTDTWVQGETSDRFGIVVDFGTTKTCSYTVLDVDTSFTYPFGQMNVIAADDINFNTGSVELGQLGLSADNTCYFCNFDSTSKRYWKIEFIKEAYATMRPVTIYNWFIDTPLTFTRGYKWGFKADNSQYNTYEVTTLAGNIKTSQTYGGRKVWELQFELQDNTLRTAFQTFLDTVRGKMYPFYWIDTPASNIYESLCRYMQLDQDYVPVQSTRYNLNSVSFNMREHEAIR